MRIELRPLGVGGPAGQPRSRLEIRAPLAGGRWSAALRLEGRLPSGLRALRPCEGGEDVGIALFEFAPLEAGRRRRLVITLRREGRRGSQAWRTPRGALALVGGERGLFEIAGSGAPPRSGASQGISLESCDPGLVVDAVPRSPSRRCGWKLRAEIGGENQLVFVQPGEDASFGRARQPPVSDTPHWLWRWLPCRVESDPNWKRNRSISRLAGSVGLRGDQILLKNDSRAADGLRCDGEPIGDELLLPPDRDRFTLEVSPSRFALAGRVQRRSRHPELHFVERPGRELLSGGWSAGAGIEAVGLRRLAGFEHHQYVLLRSSVSIGSSTEMATIAVQGKGVHPVHAHLFCLGPWLYVCAVTPGADVKVDGLSVRPRHLKPLEPGCLLSLGELGLRLSPAEEEDFKGLALHTLPGPCLLDRLGVAELFYVLASVAEFRHSVCNTVLSNLRVLAPMLVQRHGDEDYRQRLFTALESVHLAGGEVRKLSTAEVGPGRRMQEVFPELCAQVEERARDLQRLAREIPARMQSGRERERASRAVVVGIDALLHAVRSIDASLDARRVAIGKVVALARDLFLARADSSAARIEVIDHCAGRDRVFGIERELLNAFQELFENARKHGARGGPVRIEVRLQPLEERRGGVRLEVLDNGPALETTELLHVIGPGGSARVDGGFGLGYVRRVVEELHCGRLEFSARRGGGLRVRMDLYRKLS